MKGPGIDENVAFVPVCVAVLTVSDSRTDETDHSGRLLAERARDAGHLVVAKLILKDDRELIEAQLRAWIANPGIDVVLITGGTGITGRDVTPEAVFAVAEKEIPGFGEHFRFISHKSIGLAAIQSRALAAVANATLIFALPGSTGACRDGWDEILKLQLDSRYRPCNFVELLPRLNER
ncbi:molybdenum cofactor biosynthesis protein B [Sandaracinus amylolyticus]|uniref:molybdenum cofactor biosynthesis protein B n=1 Tax=Sandaracinus amylolyticus TaxID=927083 RepID=UPI003AF37E63|nr:Molybdenum cofactor biosynthesis protein B [Sandaracinus amylolyticus]